MPLSFPASFATGRKCFQMDSDGECIIVLAIPESHAQAVAHAFPVLKDTPFTITISVEGDEEV